MKMTRSQKTHLVYWLLWERRYSRYWHVILIEKYTGWWEDECQVHFVRRSHFDGWCSLRLLPQLFTRGISLAAAKKLPWKHKHSLFTLRWARRKKRSWISVFLLVVELSEGILSSYPSPTWCFSTLLCNWFCFCVFLRNQIWVEWGWKKKRGENKVEHVLIILLNS